MQGAVYGAIPSRKAGGVQVARFSFSKLLVSRVQHTINLRIPAEVMIAIFVLKCMMIVNLYKSMGCDREGISDGPIHA
jgi:hypothetical protein